MAEQFVGSGWAFPMRIGPTGGIALVSGEREIEEAIRLVLATAPGERPMRPEFGCAIHDLVFSRSTRRRRGASSTRCIPPWTAGSHGSRSTTSR